MDELNNYGPVFAGLLRTATVMALGPGKPNAAMGGDLAAATVETAFAGRTVVDADMARACMAGVWLHHGFLDESHTISQAIDTPTGSYWHGILHRREPDYSNAKYWFRRVGRHAIFEPLAADAEQLAARRPDRDAALTAIADGWDPFAFVDLVEACERGESEADDLCMQIQMREWWLLFDYSYRAAVGA